MALAIHGGGLDGRSVWLGVIAGVGGGSGLAAFYKALATGTMSIVSPVVACGAVVPFAISLATGERPSHLALGGAALALAGAVLASAEEQRSTVPDRARAIMLAIAAAAPRSRHLRLLPGARQPRRERARRWSAPGIGSLSFLVALALVRHDSLRIDRRWLVPIAAIGLCDVSANAFFALASGHGLISLVAVLGSLAPVMTVFLAHLILGERLTRLQLAGVGAALAGIVTLSSG